MWRIGACIFSLLFREPFAVASPPPPPGTYITVPPQRPFLCRSVSTAVLYFVYELILQRVHACVGVLMRLVERYSCRALAQEYDGSTDVEMDPVSEIEVRDVIRRQNLQVVGWYHSHPTFRPDPSVRDIENQGNYQVGAYAFVLARLPVYGLGCGSPVRLELLFRWLLE
jgi:proteasome lid subunit RPN8/RPN11